ncbi:DUF3703 domain-containing protein [Micromonospora sp. KC207]|nr:DUF3703 domain-containing protein [Micromonospora sp. KC207]
MPAPVRATFAAELHTARTAADPASSWRAAERAHILSQPWPWPHTVTHAVMLRRALRERDPAEAVGQVIRLAVAGPGSATGRYPAGNTGRARVSLTAPMPIPADLAAILAAATIPATTPALLPDHRPPRHRGRVRGGGDRRDHVATVDAVRRAQGKQPDLMAVPAGLPRRAAGPYVRPDPSRPRFKGGCAAGCGCGVSLIDK